MTRLAWRQLRWPAVSTAAMLGALAVFLLLSERAMTSYMRTSGLTACLAAHGDCGLASNQFSEHYDQLLGLIGWLNFVPMLAGLFWGAPLIAREIEQGTHRMVWTQSVTRRRWLAVKLAILAVVAVVVSAFLTVAFTWWFHPFLQVADNADRFSRISNGFNFQGTVLVAHTLYAFALGTAAGAVIRRTVPAMAVTIVGFAAVRLGIEAVRGHFLTPLTITYPFGPPSRNPRAGLGDWVMSAGPIDRLGNPIEFATMAAACPNAGGRGLNEQCLVEQGFQLRAVYQPASRFWPLQGIESGIFLAVSIALLGLAAWWTLRRVS
jgi:hypothetical protein